MGGGGARGARGRVDRAARQLRRGAPGARRAAGWQPEVVTDQTSRARSARRVRPGRPVARGRRRAPRRRSRRRTNAARTTSMAAHVDAIVDVPGARRGRVRLREQPAGRRRGRRPGARPRVRLPGVRPRLRAADVLRGQGPVPVGGAVGRPGGHRADGPGRRRAVPRGRAPASLARDGRRARRVPGPARRICWLGYGERARAGLRFNEMVASRRAVGADRDRPRPPGQRHPSRARTARRRRWPTARTRSPTGRSSTPS